MEVFIGLWFSFMILILIIALVGIVGYFFHPNDWKEIFMSTYTYNVWSTAYEVKIPGSEYKADNFSILFYYKSRNKYRIKERGYIPSTGYESSHTYQECLIKKIELQNGSTNSKTK